MKAAHRQIRIRELIEEREFVDLESFPVLTKRAALLMHRLLQQPR